MGQDSLFDVVARLWNVAGGGDPDAELPATVTTSGPRSVLASAFDVTGLATGAVGVASLAAAQFLAVRHDSGLPAVSVDSRQASAAFAAEALFTPIGWTRPPLWDPIAGNYRAADAWIRLHTNYAHHRVAVEQVLGARDRDAVQAAIADRPAEEVESAIVAAGGAAAVMHDRDRWLTSVAGTATADVPAICATEHRSSVQAAWQTEPGAMPFAGLRVLDLTRVIAGPVCTRFLACYGADVLRIDPPAFEEVASLLPETTHGKRTTALDLTIPADRFVFEDLVAHADVLVAGLRADALPGLGYDEDTLTALNPSLIIASLDAYGWTGPWQRRRGFDSLVQMSSGIAAHGAAVAGSDEPVPLPVQALDHATGWLMAAAIGRALTCRLIGSVSRHLHASLIGTANLLYTLTPPSDSLAPPTSDSVAMEDTATAWGPAQRVPLPGTIDGIRPHWARQAGPLGRHKAEWCAR